MKRTKHANAKNQQIRKPTVCHTNRSEFQCYTWSFTVTYMKMTKSEDVS